MSTTNFLPERNQIVALETGDWTISGGTFSVANLISAVPLQHSFLIDPTNTGTVTLSLNNIIIPSQFRDTPIQFYARVKTAGYVSCAVQLLSSEVEYAIGGGTYTSTRSTKVGSNSWTVIRSNIMVVSDTAGVLYANISIQFTQHAGLDFYFTTPFMYATYEALDYPFATSTYLQLPRILINTESSEMSQNNLPEIPLFRLIESGLLSGESVYQDYFDFEYVDEEDAAQLNYTPTPSTLVEPDAITDQNAKWLAQILGFVLDDPQQQTTPWGGLPATWNAIMTTVDATGFSASATDLTRATNVVTATFASATTLSAGDTVSVVASDGSETSFSGTFTVTAVSGSAPWTVTWSQTGAGESDSETHVVSLVDTNWSELEEFNPDYFDKATYSSWQIDTAYTGLHAGTRAALIDAAKFNLTGNQTVTVINNYASNPWRILVRTKTTETPGGVTGSQNDIIFAAIDRVKPVGFKLNHQCTASGA